MSTLFHLYSSSLVGAFNQHVETQSLVLQFWRFKSVFLTLEGSALLLKKDMEHMKTEYFVVHTWQVLICL